MAKNNTDRGVSATAIAYVEKLNLPALKRECIIRGLEFEKVCGSIPQLQTWFLHKYNNPINSGLLEKYDQWVTLLLRARGVDEALLAPEFRLGAFILKNAEGGEYRSKGTRSRIPKMREKKTRTEDKLFTGTKKALTFELQKQGLSKAEVIEKVMAKFPEAKEKSIGIWFNKCKRMHAK